MNAMARFIRTLSSIEMATITIVVVLVVLMGASMHGCAQIEKLTGPITADNPLAVETADAIGYGLGLLAAKDEQFKVKVETYYLQTEVGGLTVAGVNGILDALGTNKQEYQFLAHKLSRILIRLGGTVENGKFVDIKPIDPVLLDTGKQAYILAYKTSGKK